MRFPLWRTWPVVAGFSFAAKSWGVAMVDGLRETSFNDRAFEQLVLPPSRKRLIEALVLSHSDEGRVGADLIAGKGEGSIFLLHGPPGVGKTLTAEATACHTCACTRACARTCACTCTCACA